MSRISVDSVRQALECLYAPEDLGSSELALALLGPSAADDGLQRAQAVRGVLLDAIEMLRLPAPAGRAASASRAYDCVKLRYVSGFDVDSVARQLAIGRRQVYRDLQWAEDRLALILESSDFFKEPTAAAPEPEGGVAEEIRSLTQKSELIDVRDAIEAAVALVANMARSRGRLVVVEAPQQPVSAVATVAILRQALTLVLSAIIQSEGQGQIVVTLEVSQRSAVVGLPLPCHGETARADLIEVAKELCDSQRWPFAATDLPSGRRLEIRIPLAKQRRVLIVEDNPGTQALYDRYLAESEWEPVHAPNPRLTVDLAASRQVEAVILDIMMSESDGWTLLQHLKLSPRTLSIPVIICSVLNDPDLGLALGAAAYLIKPVSRAELLRALREVAPASR